MSQWRERAEEMLYAGESVEETFEVDDARILVTSHRVLAFTPGAEGATFQQADRPNVAGVSRVLAAKVCCWSVGSGWASSAWS